jgi:hypothetical protein
MESTFNGIEATVDTKKAEKKEFFDSLKKDLKAKISSDPDYVQKLQSLSNSIKVVNTLGAGVGGNIILDKTAEAQPGKRALKTVSAIVGYKIANIGTEPITYQTEVWTQGEDGKYVGQTVEKTLEPNGTAVLTRKFMTVLCSRPEISFTLANGKIIASVRTKGKDLDAILNGPYFQFYDDTQVNDDKVKLSVDTEGPNGTRVVKPEFVEAFGYLNNPKEKKGGSKEAKAQVTIQDMMANYVNTLLNNQ